MSSCRKRFRQIFQLLLLEIEYTVPRSGGAQGWTPKLGTKGLEFTSAYSLSSIPNGNGFCLLLGSSISNTGNWSTKSVNPGK